MNKQKLKSILVDCSPKRAEFIMGHYKFIRKDIPIGEWSFGYGISYDERISIWHTKTNQYRALFNFVHN